MNSWVDEYAIAIFFPVPQVHLNAHIAAANKQTGV
jgi:hypothetical protein